MRGGRPAGLLQHAAPAGHADRADPEGIPAAISNTAGTYLCNDISYTTLHALDERALAIPTGFIHLPFLPSMVAAHNLEEPSMDAAMMTRAVEIVLSRITHPGGK